MPITVKYQTEMDPGRRGAIANQEPRLLVSRTNLDDEIIGFGVAVARHATEDKACTATITDEVFGVTVIDRSAYADRDLTVEGFRKHDECRIMRKGTVWLPVAAAVAAGDPIHVIAATGEFSNAGGVVVAGQWDTNAAEGDLAVARLDIS